MTTGRFLPGRFLPVGSKYKVKHVTKACPKDPRKSINLSFQSIQVFQGDILTHVLMCIKSK